MTNDRQDIEDGVTEQCLYCEKHVTSRPAVPDIDDEFWVREAAGAGEHADTCEWIETRAHRVGADYGFGA